MLVEINLLPQKERKKFGFVISLIILLIVVILVGFIYLWQINSTKNIIASINKQIEITKRIMEREENNSTVVESTNSVSQLKNAINWANSYPIKSIPVMRKLAALLPERGFIQSFAYTGEGTIAITVQFDSSQEAAYFLENLNQSKWIEEANLSSLVTAQTVEAKQSLSNQSDSANNSILPRYTGQFEIKLDQQFIKEMIKKAKDDEKGVNSP